ncbi:hypothetical protein [Nonlabens sp.]|uniref:hypothetical protein n=1 Tax=Nonlabens sp. TaxID=1888209 RepID=UPI003F694F1D
MKSQLQSISILFFTLASLFSAAQEEQTSKEKKEFEKRLDSVVKKRIGKKHIVEKDTVDGKELYYVGKPGVRESMNANLEYEIILLNDKHELYASEQKTDLKDWVKTINGKVESGEYPMEKGQLLKEERAQQVATKIAAHRAKTDAEIAFAKVRGTTVSNTTSVEISTKNGVKLDIKQNDRRTQKYINTYSGFTLGFGYNFMNGEDLGINDFSYPNNNYFSIGYQWKTTLDKDKNNFRLTYGFEYQTHGTELNGNRFITQGDQSLITTLSALLPDGASVSKAKFRQDQLVFPVHLEFGGSKRKDYEDGRVRFREDGYWRVGIGGFAGFNTSSRLKLKYELDGRDIKEARINNFDNEVFLYGLDAYVGRGSFTVFGRMNLNNVFKSNSVDAQYVSFGIRIQ